MGLASKGFQKMQTNVITINKLASENEAVTSPWLRLLADHGLDFFARLSADAIFVEASAGLPPLLGCSPEYLAGLRLCDVVDGEDAAALEQALTRLGSVPGARERVVVRMIKLVTQTAWVELRLIRDSHDGGVLIAGRDITEAKQREDELTRAAAHDTLTGVPNRALLAERIEQVLAHARRSGGGFAVAVLDLDGFKRINDSLGHAVGDALLKQAAGRIKLQLRGDDTVGRIGGDEFALVLPGIASPEQVDGIARRLVESMQVPFLVAGQTLFASMSMGFALHPAHAVDAEALMRCADMALYRAKDLGRNRWQMFSANLATARSRYLELEHAMFDAVRNGEFRLHYQPIARTDGTVIGAEALMRWSNVVGVAVPPTEFIPIAEANGLINLLGAWALRTACMQAVRWDSEGLEGLSVSVNVSPRQFRHDHFVEHVRQALAESGLHPARLTLEITEGVLMHNPEEALAVLATLKRLGVHIAIDDFGTGYSSLSYLKRFPLSSLKIDCTFVRDMLHSPNDLIIVSAVLGLARELGLQVVAEGVEGERQLELLREKGCPMVQGFYIGRPMAAEDFGSAVSAKSAHPGEPQ